MIKEGFQKILSEYMEAKKQNFAGSPLADFIRNVISNEIRKIGSISYDYVIIGSAGQGIWAEVPWIAIFDKKITISAQRGYYIVYLFDAQLQGVYLSLNQGWTQYENKYGKKEGMQKIKEATYNLQKRLRSTLSDFSFDAINLHPTNTLGQGYELGHICGKFYPTNAIPSDDIIINDIQNLRGVYRELKGIVGIDLFSLEDLDTDEKIEEKIEINKIQEILKEIPPEEKVKILREKLKVADKSGLNFIELSGKRIKRNTSLSELIKAKNDYRCQVCGFTFKKKDGTYYVEAIHIRALASSKMDTEDNMLALCPNHHKIFDKGIKEDREDILKKCGKL